MSRSLSLTARRAINAPRTDQVLIALLTIRSDELGDPLRVADNTEDVISRGETWQACGFDLALPDETEGDTPRAQIRIPNVSPEILNAVRGLQGAPSIDLEFVLASDPDTVEFSYADMILTGVEYDLFTIQGTPSYENVLQEPFPAQKFIAPAFRSLFTLSGEDIGPEQAVQ